MPNSSLNSVKQILSPQKMRYAGALLWREISGVAQDYWKDGKGNKAELDDLDAPDIPPELAEKLSSLTERFSQSPFAKDVSKGGVWHAQPGEISERMWGEGYVTPGDEYITDRLIRPLGMNKDMNLLDLSAGLGGRLRKTTEETGVYITGLEPDPEIAERGMALSYAMGKGKHAVISPYNPTNLIVDRSYDCVIARETIYRVADKAAFIKDIAAALKPKAQVSFTDYIVDFEAQNKPAIVAWRASEKGAKPVSLMEMAELWAKNGITLRVHDDQTDYYKEEVKKGLARFAKFMASGVQPDKETKLAIQKRITIWALRMAAMDQGMKFFRFYGVR